MSIHRARVLGSSAALGQLAFLDNTILTVDDASSLQAHASEAAVIASTGRPLIIRPRDAVVCSVGAPFKYSKDNSSAFCQSCAPGSFDLGGSARGAAGSVCQACPHQAGEPCMLACVLRRCSLQVCSAKALRTFSRCPAGSC